MKYIGLFDEKEDIVTKEKLEAVASRVSTNEDNIAMAESDIEGLQTTVGTLQTNVGNVQTALASKQDTVVGGASTITEDNLTASRALVSNSSGKVAVSDVTSTELGYLDGVTSNVQTQLNSKQPTITVNGIIKGDGAGNLSAQDTVAAELVDLPTVPTKVSELTNDANYITAAQAPVQSVNNKTGAVSLTASDVSAIPSTLTGTAGQVLTKTVDGQEWKDAASPDLSNYIKLNTSENQVGYRPSGELKLYLGGNTPEESTNSLIMRSDDIILGNDENPNTYFAGFGNGQILLSCGNHTDESNKRQTAMLFQLEPTSTTLISEVGAIEVGLMKPETITTDYSISNPITTDTQASNIRAGLVLESKDDTRTIMTLVNNDAGAYLQFDPSANEAILYSKTQQVVIRSDNDSAILSGRNDTQVVSDNGVVFLQGRYITVNNRRITNVATPTSATDAANKAYVDGLKPKATKITLTVAGWNSTDKTQSVTVSGVLADETKQEIRVMPVDTALNSPYIASGVQCVAQAANSLTFACDKIPTEAIEVYVVIQDVNYSV